ncbi:hypothetical protein [Streptomyces sp. NPDC056061]|uniref:hypothetical protein n=1 Tax=Streptomyces sp. NPDC056061 TaxID=3345700 RepID=UPI0035DE1707
MRRELPSGTVQRWRTEAERERQRAEERALRSEEQRRRAMSRTDGQGDWGDRSASARGLVLPEFRMPAPEWPALGGLGAIVLGSLLQGVGYEVDWCAKNPESGGYNMRVSGSCVDILADASAFEVFAGHVWFWMQLAGVVSLVTAAVLWVRVHLAPRG